MSTPDPSSADGPAALAPDPVTPVPPSRGRQAVAGLLTVVVLVVVFVGILPKFGNYADAWDAITDMSVAQLSVLSFSVVLAILVYVFPFQAALPGLRYQPAFMVRQTSFTISNAVPAGGAVGLGVQYGMLAQAGFPGSAATAAIGITGVFNLFVTLAFPVLGVIAMLFVQPPAAAEVLGALAGLVAVVVLVALFTVVLRSDAAARRMGDRIDAVVAWLMQRLRREPPPASSAQNLSEFRTSTVDVVRTRWMALVASNFAQQFTQFLVLLVALRVTESPESTQVPIVAAFAAFALARLAGFIPVTPGGLGTVDAGLTGLLVAFGASNTDALATTLLWRAASWVPQVLLGIVTFVVWRIQHGHFRPSSRGRPSSRC